MRNRPMDVKLTSSKIHAKRNKEIKPLKDKTISNNLFKHKKNNKNMYRTSFQRINSLSQVLNDR